MQSREYELGRWCVEGYHWGALIMAIELRERLGVTFGSPAKSGLLNPKAASREMQRGSVAEQEQEHEMKANCS